MLLLKGKQVYLYANLTFGYVDAKDGMFEL